MLDIPFYLGIYGGEGKKPGFQLGFHCTNTATHSWPTQLVLMSWITFAEIHPVSRLADTWLSDPELRGKRCPLGEQPLISQ